MRVPAVSVRLFTIVACLGVAVGLDAGTAGAASPWIHKTTVTTVTPVASKGGLKAGYGVVKTFRGATCLTISNIGGHGVRCFAGNDVLDPCFRDPAFVNQTLDCLPDPFSHKVYRLIETSVLSAAETASDSLSAQRSPWALTLSNGAHCAVVDGAGGLFGTHPIRYGCDKGRIFLIDEPNRKAAVWTIQSIVYNRAITHATHGPRYRIAAAIFPG